MSVVAKLGFGLSLLGVAACSASGSVTATGAAAKRSAGPPPSATRPSAPPSPASVVSRSSNRWLEVTHFPELVDARLEPAIEKQRVEADPESWFFAHPETPPAGFRHWPKRIWTAFPGKHQAARVVGHHFAGDHPYPMPALYDTLVPGCGGLIDERGARCPTVTYPGVELSPAQTAELLAIANTRNDAPRAILNGYDFRTGFLFYDERGLPFAELLVDASVTKILLSPRTADESVDTMMPSRSERLRALLVELGLRQRDDPELSELLERQRARDRDLYWLRFLPASGGVPGTKQLSSLDEQEKQRLCLWYARSWLRGAPRPGAGIECEDGFRVVGQEPQACVAAFPTCELSVDEAEDCMRRQRVDPCYAAPENASCIPKRACLWGFASAPPAQ